MPVKEEITQEGVLRNHGSMGPVPCPHCEEFAIHLMEIRSKNPILAFLKIGLRWLLRCTECKYDLDIPLDQISDAKFRAEIVQSFKDGAMTEETFLRQITEFSIPALNEVEHETNKWECTGCKEDNPDTFTQCWQCGEDRPGLVEAPDSSPEEETPACGDDDHSR